MLERVDLREELRSEAVDASVLAGRRRWHPLPMRQGLIETGKNLDQARHQPSRDDNGARLQRQQLTLMLNSRPPLPLASPGERWR